jgi:hypothetical protein
MQLLSTIRLPQNLKLLSDRLPKSKYGETSSNNNHHNNHNEDLNNRRELISTSLIIPSSSSTEHIDTSQLINGMPSARALGGAGSNIIA